MTKETHTGASNSDPSDDSQVLDHRAMVKEQAAVWLIRISDNELLPDDVDDLREWIGRSDFHREYFIQLSQSWDDMSVLQELAELFAVPRADGAIEHRHGLAGFWTRKLSFTGFAATASIVACTFAILLYGLSAFDSQTISLQTAIGEQRIERLDDGSVLTLNTGSELSVDYSGDNRIIYLSRGEVNFEVAKDPHRPFVVYAGDGLVWAVGTAFNIRLIDDSVDLTVTEGRVKVYSGIVPSEPLPTLVADTLSAESTPAPVQQNEAFVKAGEALQYSQVIAQKGDLQTEQLQKKLAWQQGALIFKGETLEQAVVEVRRYTDIEIRIVDPDIKDKKIGGYYKTDDIDSLLRSMSQSFGIHVAYLGDDVIQLSSKLKTFQID